jgi:hypothetical protein
MIPFVLESLSYPGFYLGMAAVLAALFVPFLTLRRKKLFFDVVCEAKLLVSGDNDSEHSAAVCDAVESCDDAEEFMLFVIDLHNAVGGLVGVGGVDITPAQHLREISFGFGKEAHVLEAGFLQSPQDIEAKVRIDGSKDEKVVLEAFPLNRGESIRIKAVVDKPEAKPEVPWVGGGVRYDIEVGGHISGIRMIQRKWDPQKLLIYAFLAGFLGVVLDYSVIGWLREFLTGDRTWLAGPPAFLLGVQVAFVGLAAVLLILVLFKEKRSREIAGQLNSSYSIAERKPKMGWP